MCQTLLAVPLLLVVFASVGFGDTYNPVIRRGPFVGNLKIGPSMVTKGHRLWGCEIVGQDLRNSSFDEGDLSGVAFRQCDLRGATFRRAVLSNLIIDDCEWGDNDFTDAVINGIIRQFDTDTTGITVESLVTTWSYKNKDLSKCYIPMDNGKGYEFSHFNLSEAYLDNVEKALLTKCNLYKATFRHCDLTKFSFEEVVLHDCDIQSCKVDYQQLKEKCRSLHGTSLSAEFQGELDFTGAVFGTCRLIGLETDGAKLTNADVSRLTTNLLNGKNIADTKSFKDGNLVNMTLYRCDLSGVDFSRQVLVNTRFSECKFDGCKFDDAVITNTVFEECTGLTRAQILATWNSKVGRLRN